MRNGAPRRERRAERQEGGWRRSKVRGQNTAQGERGGGGAAAQEQPDVEPQLTHLRHEPLRTMVSEPHSGQESPS